ncbi:MAG: exodeoxyribonuclease VII large subunit [Candidatus Puniceispirillales bacterium]
MPTNFNLNNSVFSVSDISDSIKKLVEQNFSSIKIKGEISKPSFPASGHIYFNLKDENSIISAVIWRYNSTKININLEEGLEIICTGKLTTFSGQSKYQIIVESIEISGEGALLKLFEERKRKFLKLGYFENNQKQRLPFLPRSLAIITSKSGAVIQDMINRVLDRFPLKIYLFSVSVQGINSSNEISNAIKKINKLKSDKILHDVDAIIIARGGGSVEDLWGFNEENVIISTFESKIPIISAIGHETDVTLIDYVADLRAPTPSAAIELCLPVAKELKRKIFELNARRYVAYQNNLENLKNFLSKMILSRPKDLLNHKIQSYDFILMNMSNLMNKKIKDIENIFYINSNLLKPPIILINNLENKFNLLILKFLNSFKKIIDNKKLKLITTLNLMEANSFQKTLEKGFAIVLDNENNIIKKYDDAKGYQEGKVQFIDGIRKITFKN